MTGKIYNKNERGFAFIETTNKPHVFVHASDYQGDWQTLTVGDAVEFEVIDGKPRPDGKPSLRATNVTPIGE